jgi:centromeric protein E
MDNIHVAIRLRPLNERETQAGQFYGWLVYDDKKIMQMGSDSRPIAGGSAFSFGTVLPCSNAARHSFICVDKIFESVSNRQVYDHLAKDIIQSALNGVNGTIFAYGQTSSGKTFTFVPESP